VKRKIKFLKLEENCLFGDFESSIDQMSAFIKQQILCYLSNFDQVLWLTFCVQYLNLLFIYPKLTVREIESHA